MLEVEFFEVPKKIREKNKSHDAIWHDFIRVKFKDYTKERNHKPYRSFLNDIKNYRSRKQNSVKDGYALITRKNEDESRRIVYILGTKSAKEMVKSLFSKSTCKFSYKDVIEKDKDILYSLIVAASIQEIATVGGNQLVIYSSVAQYNELVLSARRSDKPSTTEIQMHCEEFVSGYLNHSKNFGDFYFFSSYSNDNKFNQSKHKPKLLGYTMILKEPIKGIVTYFKARSYDHVKFTEYSSINNKIGRGTWYLKYQRYINKNSNNKFKQERLTKKRKRYDVRNDPVLSEKGHFAESQNNNNNFDNKKGFNVFEGVMPSGNHNSNSSWIRPLTPAELLMLNQIKMELGYKKGLPERSYVLTYMLQLLNKYKQSQLLIVNQAGANINNSFIPSRDPRLNSNNSPITSNSTAKKEEIREKKEAEKVNSNKMFIVKENNSKKVQENSNPSIKQEKGGNKEEMSIQNILN